MESNGKRVDLDGEPLPFATSPVVWGEPGTNGQHAYFQMLHQGTDVIPVEFIAVRHADARRTPTCTRKLLANCLAQSQALMLGKPPTRRAREGTDRVGTLDRDVLARHRTFPATGRARRLLLDALTPRSLGALIALYEHRVFTSGALWGINSFDQWGVELGKALATTCCRAWLGRRAGLDASTAGLLMRV